jgi:hypothetical protein
MGFAVIDCLGLFAWGIVLGCAGLLLLGEYRRVFFENPRAVITLEIWLQVALKAGGPGYLAMILLVSAAFFLLGGMATLIVVVIDPFI